MTTVLRTANKDFARSHPNSLGSSFWREERMIKEDMSFPAGKGDGTTCQRSAAVVAGGEAELLAVERSVARLSRQWVMQKETRLCNGKRAFRDFVRLNQWLFG
jgi:hypothetical protein